MASVAQTNGCHVNYTPLANRKKNRILRRLLSSFHEICNILIKSKNCIGEETEIEKMKHSLGSKRNRVNASGRRPFTLTQYLNTSYVSMGILYSFISKPNT